MVRRWLLAFAVLGGVAATPAPAHALELTAESCPFAGTMTAGEKERVRCGTLVVPENHETPENGRTQVLQIALIAPKEHGAEGTEPVLEIHGGPGGASVPFWRAYTGEPYGRRTVILFDQRGSGFSAPALCRELGDVLLQTTAKGLPAREATAERTKAMIACRDRLIGQGFDLATYSTASTVRDIEMLRAALGIERWNISGTSYGTTVALAYMVASPQAIRAAVLDSVYPLDRPAISPLVPNFVRSVQALAETCRRDPACAVRFGDLEATFFRAIERTAASPLEVPASGEETAIDGRFRLSASGTLAVLHQLLYSESLYPILPLVIDRIAAGDGDALRNFVPALAARARSFAHAVNAAVECHERAPFDQPSAYRAAAAPWPVLAQNMTLVAELSTDICPAWGFAAREALQMPERSDIPTLVFGGALDPITPPDDSKRTAVVLGAAYVELPYSGHGVMRSNVCGGQISRQFLDDPEAALDTRCVSQVMAPAFVTEALRVPGVAAMLQRVQRMEPVAVGTLAILALLLLSTVAWPFERFRRKPDMFGRMPEREPASIFLRSGLPIALAALTLVIFAMSLGFEVRNVLESAKPTMLIVGLPSAAFEIFWLPLLAAALAIWALAGWLLEARAGLRTFGLWHRAAVIAAVLAVLVWLFAEGLVLPPLI